MTTMVMPIEYIVYDMEKQSPMLAGTRYTVAFLSTFINDPEWTVEKMVANYPLTPAQIHAAWSYYYDHQAEIDRELEDLAEEEKHIGVPASEYFAERAKALGLKIPGKDS